MLDVFANDTVPRNREGKFKDKREAYFVVAQTKKKRDRGESCAGERRIKRFVLFVI